eukprot:TRINITY_DN3765_c0_g1_i1.p1 TRINITY_DN3765_c0_g1~~TRINITY_DN3765_c0_g1_i1.p1  ORF type:complete len:759 (+),score=195.54 TRINITY_DN3765_c0_g1_i1:142-2277(+)
MALQGVPPPLVKLLRKITVAYTADDVSLLRDHSTTQDTVKVYGALATGVDADELYLELRGALARRAGLPEPPPPEAAPVAAAASPPLPVASPPPPDAAAAPATVSSLTPTVTEAGRADPAQGEGIGDGAAPRTPPEAPPSDEELQDEKKRNKKKRRREAEVPTADEAADAAAREDTMPRKHERRRGDVGAAAEEVGGADTADTADAADTADTADAADTADTADAAPKATDAADDVGCPLQKEEKKERKARKRLENDAQVEPAAPFDEPGAADAAAEARRQRKKEKKKRKEAAAAEAEVRGCAGAEAASEAAAPQEVAEAADAAQPVQNASDEKAAAVPAEEGTARTPSETARAPASFSGAAASFSKQPMSGDGDGEAGVELGPMMDSGVLSFSSALDTPAADGGTPQEISTQDPTSRRKRLGKIRNGSSVELEEVDSDADVTTPLFDKFVSSTLGAANGGVPGNAPPHQKASRQQGRAASPGSSSSPRSPNSPGRRAAMRDYMMYSDALCNEGPLPQAAPNKSPSPGASPVTQERDVDSPSLSFVPRVCSILHASCAPLPASPRNAPRQSSSRGFSAQSMATFQFLPTADCLGIGISNVTALEVGQYRIVDLQKKVVEYCVLVESQPAAAHVSWQRYSHFYELRKHYAALLPSGTFSGFPPKTLRSSVRPSDLDKRMVGLNTFVTELLPAVKAHLPPDEWNALAKFLELAS